MTILTAEIDRLTLDNLYILVRNLRGGPKWIVTEQTGPVSYKVQVNDQIWRCHTDQLLDHNVAVGTMS